MRRLFNNNLVIPFVCLLITNNQGNVLISKRGQGCSIYRGWYGLPGGKIDIGEENSLDAVSREAGEEIPGLKLKNLRICDAVIFYEDEQRPLPGIAILFTAEASGKLTIRDEEKGLIEKLAWLTKEDALKIKLTPWSKHYITKYL